MEDKFEIFLKIAEGLNEIGIIPILYGSLALKRRITLKDLASDIDVMIPYDDIRDKWSEIAIIMNNLGFFVDLENEQHFYNSVAEVSIEDEEQLDNWLGFSAESVPRENIDGINFKCFNIFQSLRMYQVRVAEKGRSQIRLKKDRGKIKEIEKHLKNNPRT